MNETFLQKKRNLVYYFIILLFCLCSISLRAANRFCRNSGNWNNINTWTTASEGKKPATVPVAGDTVFIELGRTVTIDTNYTAACAVLYIGSGKPGSGQLVFSSNSSLSVSGLLQLGGTDSSAPNSAEGSIVFAPGSKMTVSGPIIIGANDIKNNGSLDFTNGGLLQIGSAITVHHLGKFIAGKGTVEYNGSDQTVVASKFLGVYNNLTLSGSGLKTISAVSVKGLLSMEGSAKVSDPITTGPGATLQYKGSSAQVTGPEFGVLAGNPAARTFGGSGGVIINNSNGVTLGSNSAISNVLTLATGDFNIGSKMLTLYGPPIVSKGGNLITTDSSALAFVNNMPGLYIPAGVNNLDFLSVISTSGLALKGDVKCNSIDLIGKITTGSHILTATSITGAPGSLNYIIGRLQHSFTVDGNSFLFPVGDATNYTPVNIDIDGIVKGGELTVSTTSGKHPSVSSAGLKLSSVLNRYWTISNSGLVFKTYSAEFTFVPGDVPVSTDIATQVVRVNSSSGWSSAAIASRTALSIRIANQNGFGDYAIGSMQQ